MNTSSPVNGQGIPDFRVRHPGIGLAELLKKGIVFIKKMLLLIIIPYPDLGAQFETAAVRSQGAGEDFQQTGFARAVVPQHRHLFPPAQAEGKILKEAAVSECLGEPLCHEHLLPA